MYCPTCGNSVADGLKYCKNCGVRLTKDERKDAGPAEMLDGILDTIFWFAMLGLGILVGLAAVLLSKEVKTDIVAIIVIAYLAVIFGVCFMLARQVPKLIDAKLKAWNSASNALTQTQLPPVTTAQLEEYREPVMSVTDHTTRTLDEVPIKGRS
jgi:hypothetical protein